MPLQVASAPKAQRTKVFLRIRPLQVGLSKDPEASQNTVEVVSRETIKVVPPPSSQLASRKSSDVQELKFSRVFEPETSQEGLYVEVGRPLVERFVEEAQNVLLFAYGITNSGKTYTMLGRKGAPGLLPRALDDIFATLEGQNENKVALRLSFLEIYNEQIFDLLDEADARPRGGLKVKDRHGHIEVDGLRKVIVQNPAEAVALLQQGAAKRQSATNNINHQSSRSHSVCSIELLECRHENGNMWLSERPKAHFSIVDLAGSERSYRTNLFQRRRQAEANNINTSLMMLWRCIDIMRKNQEGQRGQVVPFRESKLTHLFSNHLAGPTPGQTAIIVNINPSAKEFDETQHVLAHAAIAQRVHSVDNSRKYLRAYARLQGTHGLDGRKLGRRRRSGARRGWFMTSARNAPSASQEPASGTPDGTRANEEDDEDSGVESDTALTGRNAVYRQQQQLSEENALLRLTMAALAEKILDVEQEVRLELCDFVACGELGENFASAAVKRTWARTMGKLTGEDKAAEDAHSSHVLQRSEKEASLWLRSALSVAPRAEVNPQGRAPSNSAKKNSWKKRSRRAEERTSKSSAEDSVSLRERLLLLEVQALRESTRAGELAAKIQLEKHMQKRIELERFQQDHEAWQSRALRAEAKLRAMRRERRRPSEVAAVDI